MPSAASSIRAICVYILFVDANQRRLRRGEIGLGTLFADAKPDDAWTT